MGTPAIVSAGARQIVKTNVVGGLIGFKKELLAADPSRWAIIFTLVQGTHVELTIHGALAKIYTLTTDQHQLLYFAREGCLTQMQWFGVDPNTNWTVQTTEILLSDAR